MIRTGYSFRQAAGSIDEVISRLEEIGSKYAPISDTSSTFGFIRWQKAAIKAGMKPVFGVELGVSTDRQEKSTRWDKWTFIAKDSVRPINDLLTLATSQFRFVPMLSIEQAYNADCFKIIGSNPYWVNDEVFDWVVPTENLFVSLSPASSKYATSILLSEGFKFVAMSDNRYPRESDSGFYEVLTGRNASMQTYPQHILSDDEWRKSVAHLGLPENVIESAIKNRDYILESSTAKLRKAELPIIEWPKTIRQLCEEGAVKLKCDIEDPVYKQRLEFELEMIHSKGFQDYFQIVAELVTWARARMSVGPARGSSCGSLVCYLTQITTIDPIPYGLLFARFLDFQRMDFPDIDIDFSDTNRYMVFEHLKEKYGEDKVARLGTVAMFQPRSALSEVGMSLRIPKWKCDAVAESLLERSSGDARALQTLEDTMTTMPAGIRLMEDHPEAKIMTRFEGHPRHSGIHAAGVVIASEPINEYSAVDSMSGATQCDKKDAEDGFGLLKIDALGLTQLSIFEEALHLAGLPMDALEHIPLDDDEAFKVLRDKRYSGIFQFNGMALQSISNQIVIDRLDDIINITALARPGPLASGTAHEWVRRRNGVSPITYPHPSFEPFLKDSLGVFIMQEEIMQIGREVGDLNWDQVTQLRKAMSKSLGAEYFSQFADPFVEGAKRKGITDEVMLRKTFDDMTKFGSWCISGEEEILLNKSVKGKRIWKLKEYFKLVEKPRKGRQYCPPTISLFPDGKVRPQKPLMVINNGLKNCITATFSNGKTLTCTSNHEVIVNGSWLEIGKANIGDDVLFCTFKKERPNRRKGNKVGHIEKGYNNQRGYAGGIFRELDKFTKICKENNVKCEDCGELRERMESHHNDFAGGSIRPSDLSRLCTSCHAIRHRKFSINNGDRREKGEVGYETENARLVSIEDVGLKEVFDISMPEHHNFVLNSGAVVHNCFNKSHSVAYGIISYQCCWLKAHYPFEFAAATLTHQDTPDKQIMLLREMVAEGYDYLPVAKEISTNKWSVAVRDESGKIMPVSNVDFMSGNSMKERILVGPLSSVKGIGPKLSRTIISDRDEGKYSKRAEKIFENPTTPIDSLFPIRDAFKKIMPDPEERNILTKPTQIGDIVDRKSKLKQYPALVFCTLAKINTRDENEAVNVAKRGYEIKDGMTTSLNLQLIDDTGQVFGKISRKLYRRFGQEIVDRGGVGKHLYAIKGTIKNESFIMMMIEAVRYIGEVGGEYVSEVDKIKVINSDATDASVKS